MKRSVFFSAFAFLCITLLNAQPQRGLQGGYDITDFPVVTFIWNTPDPEPMESNRFSLTENDGPLNYSVQALPLDENIKIKKNVLFLWEDMASHNNQSYFTRSLIAGFLNGARLSNDDQFNVAVFNRLHDSSPNVLTPLLKSFTSDRAKISDAINGYNNDYEYYLTYPTQSDLYLAINEGIEMLKKEPSDRAGVIVLVTAGLNIKASGASTEMETVRKNALEAGIPIYLIKYPIFGNTPEVNTLATSTYGLVSSSVDVDQAIVNLKDFYNQFDSRLYGRNYQFTFTTESERDGKIHRFRLKVDKVDRPIPPYKAPKPTFGMWVVSHIILVIILVIVLAGLVVLILFLIRRNKTKRQDREDELRMQMEQRQEEIEFRSREAVEAIRREQEDKEAAAQRERNERAKVEEYERLVKLMQTKNLFPRLQCKTGSTGFSYTISKPKVTIGRNADNDVAFTARNDQFDNMTVSGYHAEIVFNGSAFEVVNVSQSYTQGIIVNGMLTQRQVLRNGDMIGLGEALITFYL